MKSPLIIADRNRRIHMNRSFAFWRRKNAAGWQADYPVGKLFMNTGQRKNSIFASSAANLSTVAAGHVISCTKHKAGHIMKGLLEQKSFLQILVLVHNCVNIRKLARSKIFITHNFTGQNCEIIHRRREPRTKAAESKLSLHEANSANNSRAARGESWCYGQQDLTLNRKCFQYLLL